MEEFERPNDALQEKRRQLQEEMEQTNKKHKSNLVLYHVAKAFINFARRGIKMFAEGPVHGIISLAVRLFIALILYGISENILVVLIGYAVIHIISLIVGKILFKAADENLTEVANEAQRIRDDYLDNRNQRFDLNGKYIAYDDGTVVQDNRIGVMMRQECGEISLYRKDVGEEYRIYSNRRYNTDDPGVSFNEKLSSVELDNKFGIIIEKGKEIEAFKFFSPSMQVKMIKTPEMLAFKEMTIRDHVFSAVIGEPVPFPSAIDLFSWQPFSKHLKEIDKYCAAVRKQADEAHETMKKIDFIRGR